MRPIVSVGMFFIAAAMITPQIAAADGSSIDYKNVVVRGVHIGMEAADAKAAMVRQYGISNVQVRRTICMRDYVAALKAQKSVAPMKCVGSITAQDAKSSLSVNFMEDVANQGYGISRVIQFSFQQPLPSDADADAFVKKAKDRFGPPDDAFNPRALAWCSNFPITPGCSLYVTDYIAATDDGAVRPDFTPYGYSTSIQPTRNFVMLARAGSGGGEIYVADFVDQTAGIRAYSQQVNVRTTQPAF